MELYLKLMHHDATASVMYLYCYAFVILNFAHLAIQDEASVSSHLPRYKGDCDLKLEEKYKKFEIIYSLKDTWAVINNPQFSGLPVIKKIKDMWKSKKTRKLVQKKPRIKRKNITTTTPNPFNASEEEIPTTTEFYETTTRKRLPGRQNPFVLIEGTLTNTRRNLTRGLMKHTTFMYIRNFRQSPFKYREKFRSKDLLRLKRAFITLQFYITGRDLETILEDRPVIMSGFWMRQAAEFIARQYQDMKQLPGVGSPCYKWPADLVRPDLVFFIHTPRNESKLLEETKKRHERIVEIYHRMDPPVIVLDQSYNNPTEKMMADLRKIMLDKLSEKYPHSYDYLKYKKPAEPGAKKKKKLKKQKKSHNVTIEDESVKNISLSDR